MGLQPSETDRLTLREFTITAETFARANGVKSDAAVPSDADYYAALAEEQALGRA